MRWGRVYFSPTCIDGTCAHGGMARKVKQKDGTTKYVPAKRVMDCPARACPCPKGDRKRQSIRRKVARQEKRLKYYDQLTRDQ